MYDGLIKLACAVNSIKVANTKHNSDSIVENIAIAYEKGAKIVVFPELCITGYTCGDLFLQETLIKSAENALYEIAQRTSELDILSFVGLPVLRSSKLYNCAAALYRGKVLAVIPKNFMPSHSEFYELRHFAVPTNDMSHITLKDGTLCPFGNGLILENVNMPSMTIGVEICEDLWVPSPPSARLAAAGANIILNLSASNETTGKADYRRQLVMSQSARLSCGYAYANAGSGESTTDTVFSGHSIICENGVLLSESKPFEEKMILTEIDVNRLSHERQRLTDFNTTEDSTRIYFDMPLSDTHISRRISRSPFVPESNSEKSGRAREILLMQAHGLKKRLEHTQAKSAVLGISGGLDSTLALIVCVMACDLSDRGRDFIHAITLPCFGTTARTRSNAQKVCELLGVSFREIDITESVKAHLSDLRHDIENRNVVYENAQARMRTLVLMNMSNELNGLVIGTGDLSELALGWATYNGDHMSMYGVNASIPKTLIQHLIRYYADNCGNDKLKTVLLDILDTPISPELLPADANGDIAQKTEELVGPYELHDFFLYYMLRFGFTPSKIYRFAKNAFCGAYDNETILKWLRTFYKRFFSQQFKRSCLPDGTKVGSVSLSPRGDFRMPSDADCTLWKEEADKLH